MSDIRLVDDGSEIRRIVTLIDEVWGAATPLVGTELARAIAHAGGYVAGAYVDGQLAGASLGFLARYRGADALHSHVTGLLPQVRGTGLGRALKMHQRAWAEERDLVWVTWTFDPLVRRNAWFNLGVLGAEVHDYLVDFYGPIDDAVNARDESDRLLVALPTAGPLTPRPSAHRTSRSIAVPTPEDIVALRQTDPAEAQRWRQCVRDELGGAVHDGGRVVAFTRGGDYVVERAP